MLKQQPVAVSAGSSWAARVIAAGVVAIAATGVGVSAQAQGIEHGGRGGPGGHEPGMMMFGGSPEHMGHVIDHMLDGLGATDAQRTQVKQIAMAAAADLKAQREAGRGLHAKALQIFAAPTVDASAAEALRQQMLAQHDQASKRVLQAMLDVSKVLSPEQRAKLAQRVQDREAAMRDRMQRAQHDHPKGPAK